MPANARTRPPARSKGAKNNRSRKHRPVRRLRSWLIPILVVAAAVAVVVVILTNSSSTKQPTNFKTAAGVKVYGGLGPEGMPIEMGTPLANPNIGLTGAPVGGVQCNTSEQLAYHHHVHLMIFINGQPRPVPLGVGMVAPVSTSNSSAGSFATGSRVCLYWLHVHAQDGVIHIESPAPQNYYLGQFFAMWHQALTPNQIGQYTGAVTATVNGQTWGGDPSLIPLTQHSQIVLNLGGPVITPPKVSFNGTGL